MDPTTALFSLLARMLPALGRWLNPLPSPALRLKIVPDPSQPHLRLKVVDNSGRNQVVFGLTLHNDGKLQARYWRIWLASRDSTITISLESRRQDTRVTREHLTDGKWEVQLLTNGPADVVASKTLLPIEGRHTVNFRQKPNDLYLDYKLDAEGMQTKKGFICFKFDWDTQLVHVDEGQKES